MLGGMSLTAGGDRFRRIPDRKREGCGLQTGTAFEKKENSEVVTLSGEENKKTLS